MSGSARGAARGSAGGAAGGSAGGAAALVAVGVAPTGGGGRVALHGWDGGSTLSGSVADVAVDAPTWLSWSADGDLLVVASEVDRGRLVTLELVAAPGAAPRLRRVADVATGGSHPCHFAPTGDGAHVVVANYGDGVVSLLAAEDGVPTTLLDTVRLTGSGPVADRQEGSHPHHVAPVGDDVVSVVDLGADQVRTFEVSGGRLRQVATTDLRAGSGPRHLVRSASSSAAFLTCELSGEVVRLVEEARGRFTVVASAAASSRPGHDDVAHVALDEARGLLHVSNRGPDTVSTFDVTGDGLRLVGEVDVPAHPRQFALAGGHLLVGGLQGGAVSVHRVAADGRPGPGVGTPVEAPACVAVHPGRWRTGTDGERFRPSAG